MRAARLTRIGIGVDGLEIVDVPEPRPGPDELLVAVHAVSASRLELEQTMTGTGLGRAVMLPRVLGMDPAGVVVAQGADVTGDRVGTRVAVKPNLVCGSCVHCRAGREADCVAQRVLGVHRDGGAAELVAVPTDGAFPIADSVDYIAAAATVHSAAVARHMLEAAAGPVESVLVLGASGAVGSAAVQLATHRGARVVGLVSSDAKAELARADGAAETIGAREISALAPVDLVLDTTGDGDLFSAAIDRVAWTGTAVTCAARLGRPIVLDGGALYRARRTVRGVAGSDFEDVRAVLAELSEGRLRPRIAARMPLAEAAAAYRALSDRALAGKIVVEVAD
jgi:NADPH:quinone reductase-like Zn-dependent oxidoreductase